MTQFIVCLYPVPESCVLWVQLHSRLTVCCQHVITGVWHLNIAENDNMPNLSWEGSANIHFCQMWVLTQMNPWARFYIANLLWDQSTTQMSHRCGKWTHSCLEWLESIGCKASSSGDPFGGRHRIRKDTSSNLGGLNSSSFSLTTSGFSSLFGDHWRADNWETLWQEVEE